MDGRAPREVSVTGLGVFSAFGRGPEPLAAGVASGAAAFAPVTRFDTGRRSVRAAAHSPGAPDLIEEVLVALDAAGRQAGFGPDADTPILLALHAQPDTAETAAAIGRAAAASLGYCGVERVYTCACVAASTAVADAAALISLGLRDRVAVAAGYLVEPDTFAVFDAGRALAGDGRARPFSRDRSGLLLGDAVAAVVLESADCARLRGAPALATLAGWGRAGDAHHVCRPIPDGSGLARAVEAALRRAGVGAEAIGYVNANATGSAVGDGSEVAALHRALGPWAGRVPVSSTKSIHGHALEASALLELIVTILALRADSLPVNAGYLGPDEDLEPGLDLVLDAGRRAEAGYALTLNAAFGGANTALLVGAP